MKEASEPERLQRRTVSEARDGLRRVLEAIRTGELTADPGYAARLEGAILALDALLEQTHCGDRVDTPSL